ncbi:hypothetical protein [Longimicrobium terrae]|uniref:Uncharacterized protein n=1 Tax=Longimicrobium terrae TaxID=1639882 RepID=A0A841GQ84_9BACT|nr:hypothetical protein [Longimicrobium terrae]MBB4635208.1 hypothetical protein [Longimicrobium terrae]MBB6069602.1 hypothetical protein [Longimicrobium terrae]NNC31596.1 hypothetical protein [Longimicrobium terrae]
MSSIPATTIRARAILAGVAGVEVAGVVEVEVEVEVFLETETRTGTRWTLDRSPSQGAL